MEKHSVRLPYIDNAKAVLITLAINIAVVFIFHWPGGITYAGVMWDSLFCALITTAINMGIIYPKLKKMRASGEMPPHVPESRFMRRLPHNPVALGAIYAVLFAALTVGANALILRFFSIGNMTFAPWLVYKLVYAALLSAKIVECCIFRYVQPDWAQAAQGADAEPRKDVPAASVIHPLPRVGVFREMYAGVTTNIALSILIGSALGGVVLGADGSVVVLPTTPTGMSITGLLFGLITGVLVTGGVVRAMDAAIIAFGPAMLEGAVADKRLAWMPQGKVALTCLVSICVMLFSSVALRGVMDLFGISAMNFYQFTVLITIYAVIISKPLSAVLTRRCLQPDYIRRALKKAGTPEPGS